MRPRSNSQVTSFSDRKFCQTIGSAISADEGAGEADTVAGRLQLVVEPVGLEHDLPRAMTEGAGALLQLAHRRKSEMKLKRRKKPIFAQELRAGITARPALRFPGPSEPE